MSVQTFTVDQLCLSPLNVRTNQEDANATSALEASIARRGLIFPLIVHPLEAGTALTQAGASHGVLAGGRRLRAIIKLVDAGTLPPDWPIEAVVRDLDPAEITELSLAENLLGRDLRAYEVHAAIAKAHAQGATIEEIAENIGQREHWIRQQLRLGSLAPEIFDEYAAGRLTFEQAKAYASTEDQALQRGAFAHFRGALAVRHDAPAIRAYLNVGDRELDRLLRFVGPDIYRAAGGRYELDLFADEAEERGRVVDVRLLRDQADTKLAAIRQELRRQTQVSDLTFLAEPPRRDNIVDHFLQHVSEGELDAEALEHAAAGSLAALIEIDDDGGYQASWWWTSRKAKADARKSPPEAGRPSPLPTQPNSAITTPVFEPHRDRHGLTAAGVETVATLRRELLRALLVRNGARGGVLGTDFLVFTQLRLLRGIESAEALGIVAPLRPLYDLLKPHRQPDLEATDAHQVWLGAFADLAREPFMSLEDPCDAFEAYVQAGPELQALAGAVLAGLTLDISTNGGDMPAPLHDRLAQMLGGTDQVLREYWTPTAEFLGLFTKAERLRLAEPLFGPSVTATWSRLNDDQLARSAARAFAGSPRRPIDWVHPLLSFQPPAAAAALEDVE